MADNVPRKSGKKKISLQDLRLSQTREFFK